MNWRAGLLAESVSQFPERDEGVPIEPMASPDRMAVGQNRVTPTWNPGKQKYGLKPGPLVVYF